MQIHTQTHKNADTHTHTHAWTHTHRHTTHTQTQNQYHTKRERKGESNKEILRKGQGKEYVSFMNCESIYNQFTLFLSMQRQLLTRELPVRYSFFGRVFVINREDLIQNSVISKYRLFSFGIFLPYHFLQFRNKPVDLEEKVCFYVQ